MYSIPQEGLTSHSRTAGWDIVCGPATTVGSHLINEDFQLQLPDDFPIIVTHQAPRADDIYYLATGCVTMRTHT